MCPPLQVWKRHAATPHRRLRRLRPAGYVARISVKLGQVEGTKLAEIVPATPDVDRGWKAWGLEPTLRAEGAQLVASGVNRFERADFGTVTVGVGTLRRHPENDAGRSRRTRVHSVACRMFGRCM
eukprot:2390144-Pleurochrysis_carterae.AAC.2